MFTLRDNIFHLLFLQHVLMATKALLMFFRSCLGNLKHLVKVEKRSFLLVKYLENDTFCDKPQFLPNLNQSVLNHNNTEACKA